MASGVEMLAGMLKERENRPYLGPQTGIVKTPPPEITVQMGAILLDKSDLVIAAHVLSGYQRELTIEGTITGELESLEFIEGGWDGEACNPPKTTKKICPSPITIKEQVTDKLMTYTDDLKAGDVVILIPSTDEQRYYLVDRAVML